VKLADIVAAISANPQFVEIAGQVIEVSPVGLRIAGLSTWVQMGDCVQINGPDGPELAEIIALDRDSVLANPFGTTLRAGIGARAVRCGPPCVFPHRGWKGRVLNAFGQPLDGIALVKGNVGYLPDKQPPAAMSRQRIALPLTTGVAAVDLLTPICAGQRVGIFAGSGVGKTTLLAMLAQANRFDCVVLALVGERGREVREMIEETLGSSRTKTVAIVATSDESPMMRRLAARTATTVAEYFRDLGENVLLVVDSVTRYAHALREVALAAGEPPVARGYPPSVFTDIPRLLERAGPGTAGGGTITGIYSVLVDGDDHNEPVADSIRGTLDGHIVLERAIAQAGRFPAIDPLASLSRLAHLAWTDEQAAQVLKCRTLIARFEETKDLRALNAYRPGSDPELDRAVFLVPRLYELLKQTPRNGPREAIFEDVGRLFAPAA
jgi:flagellum-specific ATP synthase